MKKTLLSFVIGLLLLSSAQAQSLVIKDKTGIDVTGQTIDFLCSPGVGFGSIMLDVYNVAAAAKNVKVRRFDQSLVEGSDISICWASCYPSFVTETPDPITIDAATFSPNFTGDVTYGAIQGTSSTLFVFFDMDNQTDSSFVRVNFIIGTLGQNENPINITSLSNAYPNPAVSYVNFDYKVPATAKNASIRINNLLGTTMQEIALNKSEGKARMDISNLNNGVYFYSLMINNSTTTTRKFIVKR